MAWPILNINSLEDFLKIALHFNFGPVATFPYIFRGQSNHEWSLQSTLVRELIGHFSEEAALQVEQDCKRKFIEQAHLHVPQTLLPDHKDNVNWWALMQHYSAPTRLLDWTKSPFVAAYFAVVENWDVDGAVWLFHAKSLLDTMLKKNTRPPENEINIFVSVKPTDRIIAQQGVFTYCNNVLVDFEPILDRLLTQVSRSSENPHLGPKEFPI